MCENSVQSQSTKKCLIKKQNVPSALNWSRYYNRYNKAGDDEKLDVKQTEKWTFFVDGKNVIISSQHKS